MPNLKQEMDLYLQELLKLQFKASKGISHNVTKGTLREKFIKQTVLGQYPKLLLKSGILIDEEWQSSQVDFIWLYDNARVGNFNLYEINDCKMFMEIKSKATHAEMLQLNQVAEEIHRRAKVQNQNNRIIVGMFCYSTDALSKTVLKKFGFKYDKDLQGFESYNSQKDIFKEIDFIISLNISDDGNSSPYMVARDLYGNCTLYVDNPVIQYFLNYFK
ncbi:MAG: hypothetical protein IJ015_04970 [Ruminococcus sp.]|nr:hypothetical protein [Ruminococcus sp.]